MFIIDIGKETLRLFFEMAPYLILGLFFTGLLHVFFNKDMVVRHVGNNNIASVIKAALFGVPLPLCSCGVVPTAIYLARNGASKGAVVSFLISTPQTGIDSMIATYGMLGWLFAIFRPIASFVMGIFGGLVVRFTENKQPVIETAKFNSTSDLSDIPKGFLPKAKEMFQYSFIEFLDDISVQFIFGLVISGLISYFVPNEFFGNLGVTNGIPGMLIMIIVGIPMYVCATASIPIALTLMAKGFSPGVAFVFLAAGPATNAASLMIITKTLGKRIAILFVATISISAMAFGLLLDFIAAGTGTGMESIMQHVHHHHTEGSTDYISLITGILLFIFLILSLQRKYLPKLFKGKEMEMNGTETINIEGMTCNHCVMNVKKAISAVDGVSTVEVSLQGKNAKIEGSFDMAAVKNAIQSVGYSVV
ncbi:MAG: Permease [Ignavibacteria bacterium]|nr:Permease [Ignavibacteria bacterium]